MTMRLAAGQPGAHPTIHQDQETADPRPTVIQGCKAVWMPSAPGSHLGRDGSGQLGSGL
jgi:hypothetical protein